MEVPDLDTYIENIFPFKDTEEQQKLQKVIVTLCALMIPFTMLPMFLSFRKERKIKQIYGMPWEETYCYLTLLIIRSA